MWRGRLGDFVERVGDGQNELADAFTGGGGNSVEREIVRGAEIAEFFEMCAIGGGVELCGYDDHGFFAEQFAESQEFTVDDFVRVDWISVGEIAGVDQVDEDAGALDVTEETYAEAGAFVSPLD